MTKKNKLFRLYHIAAIGHREYNHIN